MIRHITAGGTIIFACERSLLNALGHVSTSNQICFETVKLESLIRIISVMLEKRSYWCLCDWMGIHFSMKAVKVSAVEWDVQLSKSFWLYDVQYISHLCLPQLYCWLLFVKIFKMPMMWMMFPTTDRKAADPSQARDQTDSKLKDSKERWVAHTGSSVSLQLVSWFFLFVFSLHLLLYPLSIIQNLSAKYNSLTRWLLSPIKRALSLTQWCTFVHADTDAHTHTHTLSLTACLTHCHCHQLPLESILFYFYTFPSSTVLCGCLAFFFSSTLCVSKQRDVKCSEWSLRLERCYISTVHLPFAISKSTGVLAKSKTENESIRK